MNSLRQEIQELKRKEETRERREKKNNIVLRGAKVWVGVENAKQAAERVMIELGEVGKEGTIKDAFFVGGIKEKAVVVKLDSFESKLRVMGKKNNLYGKEIYIDDLTRAERYMQMKMRQWARMERVKGRRTKVGYGRCYVDEKVYRWNEEIERMEECGGRDNRVEQ